VGLRGDWLSFPTNAAALNVALDLDPGSSTGIARLLDSGDELDDLSAPIPAGLTQGGVLPGDALLDAGFGFDLVLAVTEAECPTPDSCGAVSWGSAGLPRSPTATHLLIDGASVAYGSVDEDLPGAAGTFFAAPHGIEWDLPLVVLGRPPGSPSWPS
jgi:hypothetical protein